MYFSFITFKVLNININNVLATSQTAGDSIENKYLITTLIMHYEIISKEIKLFSTIFNSVNITS